MDVSTQIMLSYTQNESIDDIMELMQDYWLLSEEWIKVKSQIWEKTEKWKVFDDPYMKTWGTFPKETQAYLISQAHSGALNKRATEFILKNT